MLRIPIGHGEGNYFAPPEMLERIEANRQVILRYCSPEGEIGDEWNPNGSLHDIAGLCNEPRNVVGMMPHPERACEPALGSTDGLVILQSVLTAVKTGLHPVAAVASAIHDASDFVRATGSPAS